MVSVFTFSIILLQAAEYKIDDRIRMEELGERRPQSLEVVSLLDKARVGSRRRTRFREEWIPD
jgi:hypothetical protein